MSELDSSLTAVMKLIKAPVTMPGSMSGMVILEGASGRSAERYRRLLDAALDLPEDRRAGANRIGQAANEQHQNQDRGGPGDLQRRHVEGYGECHAHDHAGDDVGDQKRAVEQA